MLKVTFKRHRGRKGWSARLWLGARFLDLSWFHYKEPVFPTLSPEFKAWLHDYLTREMPNASS